MAREATRRDPGGLYRLIWKVRINPYLGEAYSSSSLSRAARGKADSLTIQWVEDGNMGTVRVRLNGTRLAVETGEGHVRGGVPVVV